MFYRPLLDDFTLVKTTAVVVLVIAAVAGAAVRAIGAAEFRIARTPFVLLLAAFSVIAAATLIWTVDTADSLIGQYGRYLGVIPYLAYVTIGALALHLFGELRHMLLLLRAVLVAGLVAGIYTVVQWIGLDPWEWVIAEGRPVFGTLGNSNFASAVLAMTVPVAAWQGLRRRDPVGWQVAGWLALVVCSAGVAAARGAQGMAVIVVGAAFFGLAWLADKSGRVDRVAFSSPWRLLGLAAAMLVVGLGLLVLVRPIASSVLDGGFDHRLLFYEAAARMIADRPFLGAGMDTFGTIFTRFQPAEHAIRFGFTTIDEPHSVPLGMFVSGGFILGLAYLALVAYVGWRLLEGLSRTKGEDRQALAAIGAVWLGYQVQSLVSIDEPALPVLHFVSAGAIIAFVERPAYLVRRLPWRPTASRRRSRTKPVMAPVLIATVIVVAAVGGWTATRLFRADLAAARADGFGQFALEHQNAAVMQEAMTLYQQARALAPWEGAYPFREALFHARAGQLELARQAQLEAAGLEQGLPQYWLNLANLEEQLGDLEAAATHYRTAVAVDPRHPELLVSAATFFAAHGDRAFAEELLDRALALDPDNVNALRLAEQLGV